MAELGIIASAITVGECAARLSVALYNIAQTLKNAPQEIAAIAEDVSALSSGLLVLADALKSHLDLCRKEVFYYINSVLRRFKQVEGELRSLTTTENSMGLTRIKWLTRKPKAKVLLKKVESIKSALTLALSIMRLAKEETIRSEKQVSNSEPLSALKSTSNKFRRVAESVVHANRQAVEDAQKGDQTISVGESELQSGAQLKLWRADSIDSATWLYHLVFSPHSTPVPALSPSRGIVPGASPVVEYLPDKTQTILTIDEDELDDHPNPEPYIGNTAIIRWTDQTKPSYVVDKLLHAWTTLTEDQIKSSATRDWQDRWVDEVEEAVHKVNKAEDEREGYGEGHGDDDDDSESEFMSAEEESSVQASVRGASTDRTSRERAYVRYERPSGTRPQEPEFSDTSTATRFDQHDRRTRKSQRSKSKRPSKKEKRKVRIDTSAQDNPEPSSQDYNPFQPIYNPQWPLQNFSQPSFNPQQEADNLKEDTVIGMVEKLLQQNEERQDKKQEEVSPRFNKLLDILLEQQEHYAQLEEERQYTTTETDEGLELKILKLEQLLHAQQEEQIQRQAAAESAWRVEKAEWDAKASQRAQEIKDLAEKEIAAAQAAKKAAQKALKFAKAEASKKAKDEAEAKAAAERLKVDEEYKKRIQLYEERLEIFHKGPFEGREYNDRGAPTENQPLRRTCITDGGRSIEVAEYTTERLEPFINTSQLPPQFTTMFQDELHHGDIGSPIKSSRPRPRLDTHRRRSYRNSWSSMDSLRSPTARSIGGNTSQPPQQVILLPSQINRKSAKISQMQASLDKHGVLASFEDLDEEYDRSLTRSSFVDEDVVRSTIFWEPPLLILGSELLRTLRTTGWRPFYVRTSNIGQTYFLGDQPIHVNFFRPDYKPQLAASTSFSRSENVMVAKDLVEEHALRELGFRYRLNDKGEYILDCRLSASDIEDLIDRSFLIRETSFRRAHRQLQWNHAPESETGSDDGYVPSLTSRTTCSRSIRGDSDAAESICGDQTPQFQAAEDDSMQDPYWAADEQDQQMSMYNSGKAETVVTESPTSPLGTFTAKGPLRLRTGRGKVHAD